MCSCCLLSRSVGYTIHTLSSQIERFLAVRFETNKDGHVLADEGNRILKHPAAKITASLEGVVPESLVGARESIRFTILLEPVLLGVAYTAYYAIIAVSCLVLFSMFICSHAIQSLINTTLESVGAQDAIKNICEDGKTE